MLRFIYGDGGLYRAYSSLMLMNCNIGHMGF